MDDGLDANGSVVSPTQAAGRVQPVLPPTKVFRRSTYLQKTFVTVSRVCA